MAALSLTFITGLPLSPVNPTLLNPIDPGAGSGGNHPEESPQTLAGKPGEFPPALRTCAASGRRIRIDFVILLWKLISVTPISKI